MISSFVVAEFQEKVMQNQSITFAYYFCDNKSDKRKTATAVLRGLIFQLLRQRPNLFKNIKEDYAMMQDELCENFNALARILAGMLSNPEAGEVYLLLDALDECETSSLTELLHTIKELFLDSKQARNNRSKLILTHRPHRHIESHLNKSHEVLRITFAVINEDLAKFIGHRVEILSQDQEYSDALGNDVESALKSKAGGTFLWASMILDDLSKIDSNGDSGKG